MFVVGLCGCRFLGAVAFLQGLSLACLVRLLLFVKQYFSEGLLVCLFCVAAVFFGCCAVGSFQGLSLACLVCLLLFVKCFVSIGFLSGCRFVSQLGFSSGFVDLRRT